MTLTLTDLVCGAGGSSSGAELVDGVQTLMAANHWDKAIATHNHNLPHARHDCSDISQADPRRYPATDILWASPECVNHSQAKGQKEIDKTPDLFGEILPTDAAERSRATMWDVVRFVEAKWLAGRPYKAFVVEFSGHLDVRIASELRWNVAYMSATGAELVLVRRVAPMKPSGSVGERAVSRQLGCSLHTGVGGRYRSLLVCRA